MPDLGSAYVNIIPKAPGIEGKIEGLLSDGSPLSSPSPPAPNPSQHQSLFQ